MAELSLWLDYYDDIYSDFDSRHYLKRRISEDFLHELHLAMKYKKERASGLVLLLPQEKREEDTERIIIDSLKSFFTEQFRNSYDKFRKKLNTGFGFLIAGFAVMGVNSFISFRESRSFFSIAVRIILEPAGWFLLWLAFDILFYDLREIKKEREFFSELSEMNIHFKSI
jgi:hypothetical protein